jgi:hypothetical protein
MSIMNYIKAFILALSFHSIHDIDKFVLQLCILKYYFIKMRKKILMNDM